MQAYDERGTSNEPQPSSETDPSSLVLSMQRKTIDLKGQTFGHFTVVRRVYPWQHPRRSRQAYWLVRCHCGEERIRSSQSLRLGLAGGPPLRHYP
jgi:hypothetical protein